MSSYSLGIAAGGSPRTKRRSYWLIASVAVNLILIGLIAAWVMGMNAYQPLVGWQRDMIPSLSPKDAEIVRDATERMLVVQNKAELALPQQYATLKQVLKTSPFDREQCGKVLSDMGVIREEQQNAIGQIFLEEVSALSPEARVEMVAAMNREARRWHPPWH